MPHFWMNIILSEHFSCIGAVSNSRCVLNVNNTCYVSVCRLNNWGICTCTLRSRVVCVCKEYVKECMLAGTAGNVWKAANGNSSVMSLFNLIIRGRVHNTCICGVLVRAPALNPEGASPNPTRGWLLLDEYNGLDFRIWTCSEKLITLKTPRKVDSILFQSFCVTPSAAYLSITSSHDTSCERAGGSWKHSHWISDLIRICVFTSCKHGRSKENEQRVYAADSWSDSLLFTQSSIGWSCAAW